MGQGKVRLEPLVEAYMEKSRVCIESLNDMEEVDEELVVDVKACVIVQSCEQRSVDLKWQRFLTFKYTFDEKIQEMDETAEEDISTDEPGLEVKKEVVPDDLTAEVPTSTS